MGVAATRAAGRPMGLLGRRGWSRPRAYTLASVLPFAAVGRLCLGVIAAGVLRARWPAGLQALARVFGPAQEWLLR